MAKLKEHPTVRDAQLLADKYKKDLVIIFHLDNKRMGFASYGQTTELCHKARNLGNAAYEGIYRELEALQSTGERRNGRNSR